MICAANKIDIDMSVTTRHFEFMNENELPFYFVSASSGINVVRLINESILLAIKHRTDPPDGIFAEMGKLVRGPPG